MSWKTSGQLLKGPPTSTNSQSLDRRFKPNLGGLNAFQREQQLSRYYKGDEHRVEGKTEWDVLRENHRQVFTITSCVPWGSGLRMYRFIRDDEDVGDVSWEERLARAYESKLFKEFALVRTLPLSPIIISRLSS